MASFGQSVGVLNITGHVNHKPFSEEDITNARAIADSAPPSPWLVSVSPGTA
jgi:hypothetical protein